MPDDGCGVGSGGGGGGAAVAQTESHRVIEHLMIAANEQVAGLLEERRVPALFRVHERPDAPAVERLVDQLESLGVPTPSDSSWSTSRSKIGRAHV